MSKPEKYDAELVKLVMPDSWAKTVEDARKHLASDCPLAEDEDIIAADKAIGGLISVLMRNIRVWRVSDDAWSPSEDTVRALKRDLKAAGILIEV